MQIRHVWFGALLVAAAAFISTGCGGSNSSVSGAVTLPATVVSTSPANNAVGVSTNSAISATFSRAMNPSTINSSSFTVSGPSGPAKKPSSVIQGTVTYSSGTATFTPATALAVGTVYTATLSTSITDANGKPLAQPVSWIFTTAGALGPSVSSVSPLNAATNVPRGSIVTAKFNAEVNNNSVTTSTFTLASASGPVAGTVTCGQGQADFNPAISLAANTTYTATLTTGVTDIHGTPLASAYTWTFTTGSADVAPVVLSTTPLNQAISISTSTIVTAKFNEELNNNSVTTATFTLTGPSGPVSGTVTSGQGQVDFNPLSALQPSQTYTATLTTGVTDMVGTPLASAYTWTFTTASQDIAPTITSMSPQSGSTGVATNSSVTANFSEAMNNNSVTTSTFTVQGPSGPVSGTVTCAEGLATFNTTTPFASNTTYTATISTAVTDVGGTHMVSAQSWSFTTGP